MPTILGVFLLPLLLLCSGCGEKDPKTLRKWIDAMPYEFPYLLTAPWQKLIYSELGYPPGVEEGDFAKIKAPKEYRGEQ
ncbi:hypothetical protein FUA23_21945 [Neolewinella aurantiaca]|uniref:Uncharacterized protein n=1 Tax=Neolewinella aurantiaca TaxID=2602767 RepID=A0A5C7F928_9BACT|nr:hypothetical protein [Neolewinella aurantiaca]TXF81583.1 hypothetical protein FUA23_21945 [Neolewinella aurantiaca]